MTTARRRPEVMRRARRGTVLIVTMVLVFTLAAMTCVLCGSMRVQTATSANYAASLQASTIERGAEQYLLGMLASQTEDPMTIPENEFACVPVGEGYYWLVRPDYGDTSLPAFGLVDESSKLNINSANYEDLMMLPEMTDDVASAITDWRDADSDVSQGGAESDYYLSLPEPYNCKNAPFESVEELLMVRGATRELLYGQSPQQQQLGVQSTFSGQSNSILGDFWAQHGIYDLLTIYSAEPTTAPDGSQRLNLSDRNQRSQVADMLRTQLGDSRGNEVAQVASAGVTDIFDLYLRAKLTPDELNLIADYITPLQAQQGQPGGQSGQSSGQGQTSTSTATAKIRGRININTAPREVLMAIPGLEQADVDKLLAARPSIGSSDAGTLGWVADTLGDKSVGLGARVTGRGYVYSADILAVSGNGRGFKRVRVVIDMTGTAPQIVYRRDLTSRGWPMDPQILSSLRAGEGPGEWSGASGAVRGGPFQ